MRTSTEGPSGTRVWGGRFGTLGVGVAGLTGAALSAVLGACASGGGVAAKRAGAAVPHDTVQVGYGSQDRRRMTGSVGTVSGDVAKREHMTRVEEMLRRIPGIVLSNRSDGSFSISIRGSSSSSFYGNTEPLVVIDGVPVTDGPGALRAMPPEDVERIDVLKDAEAAIYGARAANGVILVRTRHAEARQS